MSLANSSTFCIRVAESRLWFCESFKKAFETSRLGLSSGFSALPLALHKIARCIIRWRTLNRLGSGEHALVFGAGRTRM